MTATIPLHSVPHCAMVVISRTGLNLIETECTILPIGPSVETIIRGVFGDTRDSKWSLILFECPASSAQLLTQFMAEPIVDKQIHRELFKGSCDPVELVQDGQSQGPLAILRPLPYLQGSAVGETVWQWQWQWFENAEVYRAAILAAYDQGLPWPES